jgi:hypothetical protein
VAILNYKQVATRRASPFGRFNAGPSEGKVRR